ncbi:MAG: S8/S53 family peptidase [Candidatus Melainabacteria bacterium]|nr:S8/S53 family peptidase [Candidatus Melainabacteria bacterium]
MKNGLLNLLNGTQLRKAAVTSLAALIGLSSTFSISASAAPANGQAARATQAAKATTTQRKWTPQQIAQWRAQQTAQMQYAQRLRQQQQYAQYNQHQLAAKPKKQHRYATRPDLCRSDLVLVMPKQGAEKESLNKALEDSHGTVIGSLGKGEYKVIIIKAEKGKAQLLESNLSKDTKNFQAVNVNRPMQLTESPHVPTDPKVSLAWHLPKMHAFEAMDKVRKGPNNWFVNNSMAILDSGCSWNGDCNIGSWGADVTGVHKEIAEKLEDEMGGFLGTGLFGDDVVDLENEIEHWGNAAHATSMGTGDNLGHGTQIASLVGGRENKRGSVGMNPDLDIVPIKITDTKEVDDLGILAGMIVALERRVRIVNISTSGINDEDNHECLHELFKYFYYKRQGLVFVAAGNKGERMKYKSYAYINTVSAIKEVSEEDIKNGANPLQLVTSKDTGGGWASNTGRCVDFCAPGIGIMTTNQKGESKPAQGTSFAAPLVAAVASLVTRVNPKLSALQVQQVLIQACGNTQRTDEFGFGMPDADKAVAIALGMLPK